MPDQPNIENKIRTVLNGTGFPFQHWCASSIASLEGFQVAVEVPFTYPATNGPLLGVPGQIDILACAPSSLPDWQVCFLFECKKASDKIKHWVFIPNSHQAPKWPTFVYTPGSQPPTGNLGVTRSVHLDGLGYVKGADYDYGIHGIELNTSLSINRETDEKVYKPMKQVAHAARGFEFQFPKVVEGIGYFRSGSSLGTLYLPVIVTTASLHLARFAPEAVTDGDIQPDKLTLDEPRKWVSFEFPLPDYLGYTINRPEGSVPVGKRTLFVVNAQFLDEFCRKALSISNVLGIPD